MEINVLQVSRQGLLEEAYRRKSEIRGRTGRQDYRVLRAWERSRAGVPGLLGMQEPQANPWHLPFLFLFLNPLWRTLSIVPGTAPKYQV